MNHFSFDLFRGYTENMPVQVTLDDAVRLITSDDSLRTATLTYRHDAYVRQNSAAAQRVKAAMPCLAIAVRFDGGKRKEHIVEWTGLSLVDIDHVEEQEVPALMERIRTDAHTLLAYITISGRGIRILYRWTLSEGDAMDRQQPQGKANTMRYAEAFRMGNDHYAHTLGVETDRQCKNPTRLCGLAHDPQAYYNPESVPFVIAPPKSVNKPHRKAVGLSRVLSVVKEELAQAGVEYCAGHHNEYISRMGYLMNLYGVDLEEVTRWAVEEFNDYAGDVPAILRSCYTHTDEFHTRRLPGKKKGTNEGDNDDRPTYPTMEEIERYLNEQAAFRYNVITGKGEYKEGPSLTLPHEGGFEDTRRGSPCGYPNKTDTLHHRASTRDVPTGNDACLSSPCQPINLLTPQPKGEWKPIDNRFIHTLWKGLAARFKIVRVQDVHQLLMSEFVPPFNPFEEYFDSLPVWDGETDYIAQVAATVTTVDDPDIPDDITFEWAFRKWIVGLVAGLFLCDKVNEEILVLVGKQGTFKTTWLARLLPPQLQSYFRIKTDSRHFDKDDKLALAEFALICLEELEALRPGELNQLKSLTTDKYINERPAYARYKEERVHIASFCGTSNNLHFLNDPSGERRWLPFEVKHIANPHDHPLPYEGLYAQALHLWREGFHYWFEGEEIDRLNLHAQRFQVPDLLHDLIHTHYRVPIPGEAAVFLTTADIVAHIGYALKTPPALHHIGRIMREAGYAAVRCGNRRGYIVVRLDSDRIEAARRMAGRK